VKAYDNSNAPSPQLLHHQTDSLRPAFVKQYSQVPQAILEGRRLYVGNMPYMAKKEDIRELFGAEKFNMLVSPFYLVEYDHRLSGS
jgi:hypothetical protein